MRKSAGIHATQHEDGDIRHPGCVPGVLREREHLRQYHAVCGQQSAVGVSPHGTFCLAVSGRRWVGHRQFFAGRDAGVGLSAFGEGKLEECVRRQEGAHA